MSLSKAAMRCLREMSDAEAAKRFDDAEIVCDGGECWLGERRIARKTVLDLLRHVVISDRSLSMGCERYVINETGRQTLLDPSAADRVREQILAGRADS